MNIERLDERRMLITIENSENELLGKYSFQMFAELLTLAAVKAGFSLDNKRLSAKILSGAANTFLLVTIDRRYWLTNGQGRELLVAFRTMSDLIDAASQLTPQQKQSICSAKLYRFRGTPVIYIKAVPIQSEGCLAVLSEFGTIVPAAKYDKARLDEHGTLISDDPFADLAEH